ncbi:MAG: DUF1232 domain-containing protein [Bdellovibrionales bacterium]|nr:DUF1232 domain-containing protein [Bdellovibrionales bacterium]
MSDKKNHKEQKYSAKDEAKVRKSFLEYFKKNKSKIPFPERVESLYVWLTKGSLSLQDKAMIVGALLYFINPFDAVPDLTPFVGFIDDLGVIGLVYRYLENRALDENDKDQKQ